MEDHFTQFNEEGVIWESLPAINNVYWVSDQILQTYNSQLLISILIAIWLSYMEFHHQKVRWLQDALMERPRYLVKQPNLSTPDNLHTF